MKLDVSNSKTINYGDLVKLGDDELHTCLVVDLKTQVGLIDTSTSRLFDTYSNLSTLNATSIELVAKSSNLTLTTRNLGV